MNKLLALISFSVLLLATVGVSDAYADQVIDDFDLPIGSFTSISFGGLVCPPGFTHNLLPVPGGIRVFKPCINDITGANQMILEGGTMTMGVGIGTFAGFFDIEYFGDPENGITPRFDLTNSGQDNAFFLRFDDRDAGTPSSCGIDLTDDSDNGAENNFFIDGTGPLDVVLPFESFVEDPGFDFSQIRDMRLSCTMFDESLASLDFIKTISGTADLSILKTDSPDPIFATNELTYTITVSNAGPATAENVVVTDTLPIEVGPGGKTSGCSEDPGGVPMCSLGNIAPGNSAQYTVKVIVDPGINAIILNQVSVESDTIDLNSLNDNDEENTQVISSPPVLEITSHDFLSETTLGVTINEPVLLTATATDDQDGDISGLIEWFVEGTMVGTGSSILFTFTEFEFFDISASVTDSDGEFASDDITVEVFPDIMEFVTELFLGPGKNVMAETEINTGGVNSISVMVPEVLQPGGSVTFDFGPQPPQDPPEGFVLNGQIFDISTSNIVFPAEMTINYDPFGLTTIEEKLQQVFRFDEDTGMPEDVTTGVDVDENKITFTVDGNSPFGLFIPDNAQVIGGELIPIETTSLILSGAQSFSWMIPIVLSVLGIGLVLVRRIR